MLCQTWDKLKVHEGPVTAMTISLDGKFLATAGDENTIKIWEIATGAPKQTLKGHSAEIYSIAFSANGKWLASGSADKTVKVWDTTEGKELHTLSGHEGMVRSVAFSPDSKWLVSGSNDKTVRVWDPESGQPVSTIQGHTDSVTSVAFSPDGKMLATAGWDRLIKLWETGTWKERRTLQGHKDYSEVLHRGDSIQMTFLPAGFSAIAFSPDGQLLASVSNDRALILWDVAKGKKRSDSDPHVTIMVNGRFVNRPPIKSVLFSPDGKYVIVGGDIGLLTSELSASMFGWQKQLADATSMFTICPDGNLLVADADGTVTPYAPTVWQAKSWERPSWSTD